MPHSSPLLLSPLLFSLTLLYSYFELMTFLKLRSSSILLLYSLLSILSTLLLSLLYYYLYTTILSTFSTLLLLSVLSLLLYYSLLNFSAAPTILNWTHFLFFSLYYYSTLFSLPTTPLFPYLVADGPKFFCKILLWTWGIRHVQWCFILMLPWT
jgi:hypothetical protein